MKKQEAIKRFRELANEAMKPWEECSKILREIDGHNGRVLNDGCAVKSPSLEVYDSFHAMANQMEMELQDERNTEQS
jgi:hypothetical protein